MPLPCVAGPGSRLYVTPPTFLAKSISVAESSVGSYDRGVLSVIPDGFGDAEFCLQVMFRCLSNATYVLGDVTAGGLAQRQRWSDSNPTRYGTSGWWFNGNFLLDGHQNAGSNFQNGTFSVQIAAGRPRWTFGDGAAAGANTGSVWGIQDSATNTVLDNAWHELSLVRRFSGGSSSDLEMWVDGTLVDTQTSSARTNMATTYWDSWTGYPSGQQNWMFGTEKQAALGVLSQWEDFKGEIGELRFWSLAPTSGFLGTRFRQLVGNETGLVGLYRWNEQTGTTAASSLSGGSITLVNSPSWNSASPV